MAAGSAGTQTAVALLGLREMLLEGQLAAGDRLVETQLVQRLGVSRTPVRAALARLEAEGLVEPAARGGYVVRSFSFDDVADAIDVRGTLEGMAARLCAVHGLGRRHRAALERCVRELDAVVAAGPDGATDLRDYERLNCEFHRALVDAAENAVLTGALERVTALPFASPGAFVSVQGELDESRRILVEAQEQHHEILAAVLAGDAERAERLTRAHAGLSLRNLTHAREHARDVDPRVLGAVPGIALIRARAAR